MINIMKKLFSILLAALMAFSVMVLPVSAADAEAVEPTHEFTGVVEGAEDIYDDLKNGEYENAIDKTIAFIEDIYNLIHNLIGNIMAVIGKECAACGEFHTLVEDDAVVEDDLVVDDTVVDDVVKF